MLWLMIGLGGAAGAYARYHFSGWVYARSGPDFPWGTLAVNLFGSLVLGLLLPHLELREPLSVMAALITVGCIGAFTTFSTFAFETVMLIRGGQRVRAALYVAASLGLGLVAITLGLLIGHRIL